ncbi:hypothetical protein BKA64DRAFT_645984 [Cadophora sp. MPI-SDFR-AT-0126]|nr:hypothetical protein BKA64DRAFT_645984 [Leotiomycetes sp. MPI-SDFR-AT-0126]
MSTTQQVSQVGTNAIPGTIGISFLFATALFTYGIRMWNRVRPTFQLSIMDYIITAALFCEVLVLVCLFKAIDLGYGYPMSTISPATLVLINKYFFTLGLFAFWASSLARISIGTMLLRFEISKAWKVIVWIAIAIQIAMPIGANIFMLLQCRPIRAFWDLVPDAVCWPPRKSQSFGYIYSVVGVTSDLVFAIMPMFFIWTLHRPAIERALVSALMALGLLAAVAGIFKVYYINFWNPRNSATLRDWMPLFWWYRVEEIGLIAASCAPFVKPLMARVLGRLGATPFRFATIRLNTVDDSQGSSNDASKNKSEQRVHVRSDAV